MARLRSRRPCRPRKNDLKPWLKPRSWCIPEKDSARFVAQMEQVLDVYALPPDEEVPTICMDEAGKQMLDDLRAAARPTDGGAAREDYHYERAGVAAIFMFFDPNRGWRRVSCRESRTRQDWAHEVRRLLEDDYPGARKVRLVCDNLNTHSIASLYATFPAEQAHRLARRLEIVHTPRNGSWLNVAEIELSILARQCLDRRLESRAAVEAEVKPWEASRNDAKVKIKWSFRVADAHRKLAHLYPQPSER